MTTSPRTALLVTLPGLAACVVAGTTVASGMPLDARLATRFGLDGAPVDHLSLGALTALSGGLALLLGYGLLALGRRTGGGQPAGAATAGSAGVSALLAALHVVTVGANEGVAAEAVRLPAAGLLAVALVTLLAAGVGWLARPEGDGTTGRSLAVAPLEVVEGEAVVWSGTARAGDWSLHGPGLLLAALLVGFLLAQGEVAAAAVGALAGGLAWTMTRARATVGPAGVRVRFGPLGLLSSSVALHEVASVGAEVVDPMAFGGWGYRVVPGTRAVVVRAGEALRVGRVDGPDLVVTVDGAPLAAGVLRAHLARASAAG